MTDEYREALGFTKRLAWTSKDNVFAEMWTTAEDGDRLIVVKLTGSMRMIAGGDFFIQEADEEEAWRKYEDILEMFGNWLNWRTLQNCHEVTRPHKNIPNFKQDFHRDFPRTGTGWLEHK